jgi:hypothetical protein
VTSARKLAVLVGGRPGKLQKLNPLYGIADVPAWAFCS